MIRFICMIVSLLVISSSATFSFADKLFTVPDSAISNPGFRIDDNDSATIVFFQNIPEIVGSGAFMEDGNLVISKSGSYVVTGDFTGSVLIDTPDSEKVSLYLNGVSLSCQNTSCINVKNADKNLTIVSVEGSINLLQSTFTADVISQGGVPDAAIYSKADLKFKGEGTLYISCSGGKGINCRDDVSVMSSTICITATDDGLRGKDSVTISGGDLSVITGADGIRSSNEENPEKGFVSITGGNITIESDLDAVQAYTSLNVSGGNIRIVSGGGAGEGNAAREEDFRRGFGGGKHGPGWDMDRNRQSSQASTSNEESKKGLKSDILISITGGSISADCADDALHSNQNITLSGGILSIASGDDGIHADNSLTVSGGEISISQSYEGIEAADLNFVGGRAVVYASDDGINAAGGELNSSGSQMFGGRGGFGGMMSASSGTFEMSGGYLLVNSSGDGVDVNGNTEMTGGTLLIYGPTNSGNAALDYDETFSVSGGTLLAIGSAGMAQAVTASEPVGMIAFTCSIPAETVLHISTDFNNDILTFISPKSYSCVVYASENVLSGETYHVYAQGEYSLASDDGYLTGGVYTPGTLLGSITP